MLNAGHRTPDTGHPTLLPEPVSNTFDRLDVVIRVGDIRIIEVEPVTDPLGEPGPFLFVFENTFPALRIEVRDTVGLDPSSPIDCDGFEAETLGELVDEVDDYMVYLEGMDPKDAKQGYGYVISCLDDINNGRTVDLGVCEGADGDLVSEREPTVGFIGSGLMGVSPNPFNSSARVSYRVPEEAGNANVTIKVYNVTGREVATLVNESQFSGEYSASWNGRSTAGDQVTRGIYFLRIVVGDMAPQNVRILYLP